MNNYQYVFLNGISYEPIYTMWAVNDILGDSYLYLRVVYLPIWDKMSLSVHTVNCTYVIKGIYKKQHGIEKFNGKVLK